MQSIVFKLPDLGEGVVEAEIVAWHVAAGQEVRVDQPLVDVMTDKATVTIPSGFVGRVVQTHGVVGQTVSVGASLVSFDTSETTDLDRIPRRSDQRDSEHVNGSACLPMSMSSNSVTPLVQQAMSPGDAPHHQPQAS